MECSLLCIQGMAKKKSNPISRYLSSLGKKGGLAGKGKAKARTSEQARAAVNARWDKARKAKEDAKEVPPVEPESPPED